MLLRSVLALVVLAVATADGVLPAARGVPRLTRAIVQKRAVPLSLRGGAAEAAAEDAEEAKKLEALAKLGAGEIPLPPAAAASAAAAAAAPLLHGTAAAPPPSSGVKVIAVPEASQEKVARLPDVDVHNIAKFNNWDHRECCVGNAQQWREYMDEFLKKPKADIPKKIHQIWIGHKAPPIIWCDSWRKRYRSQYPGWEYKLWTDAEVAKMKLRTKEFYDKESMFQCKADLLRLEILWEEGGIYIDADMVWFHIQLCARFDVGVCVLCAFVRLFVSCVFAQDTHSISYAP